jgi:uncharacterized cupredoxin-like copper-binding protein
MSLPQLVLPLLLLAPAATAAAPDFSNAARVDVTLSSFAFAPHVLHLKAGKPVVLHLVNQGSGGHDFTAPAFFAASTVRPEDSRKLDEGSVEVAGHAVADVALVPTAGWYRLRCSHTLHSMLGMKGQIVVD